MTRTAKTDEQWRELCRSLGQQIVSANAEIEHLRVRDWDYQEHQKAIAIARRYRIATVVLSVALMVAVWL